MPELFSNGLAPALDLETQAFIRSAYGVLLLATLLLALPHARRFFLSERFGGYTESSPLTDRVGSPLVAPVLLALWLAAAVCLVLGRWTVAAAAVSVVLAHHFFVRLRWRSVLRGMGAPGFMSFWLGTAVLVLELTTRYASGARTFALFAIQVDFALIFLSAGIYKLLGGYRKGDGVDLGLANPQWGYWWRIWAKVPPRHAILRWLNQLGWATEVVAAVLMLIPPTRFVGGAIIVLTFAFIRTQIRLGVLCEVVALCAVFFFHPGSVGARLAGWAAGPLPEPALGPDGGALATAIVVLLAAYLVVVVLAHLGLAANLYGKRHLGRLQRPLELFTNTFGVIIWRVFSVDVVGFFVRLRTERDGARAEVARWGWRHGLRYAHVGEAIAVTSLFTALKYHPGDEERFRTRLLRYARTVPRAPGDLVVFEIVSVEKGGARFEHLPVAEYVVDAEAGTVEERVLVEGAPLRVGSPHSPVHPGSRPGSYAPAGT